MKNRWSALAMPALVLAGVFRTSSVTADVLPNAWQITDSSTASGALTYATNVPSALHNAATNSTGGFSYTVYSRFVTNFSGTKALFMAYGLGSRRFLIWWELNGNGDLTAELEGGLTYTLTTNGTGRALYHTHEIIFTGGTASYRFDGQFKTNGWLGSANAMTAGQVVWGAGSATGRGQINFHSVAFSITNGLVASYYAGTQGNPPVAPDPVTLGWTLTSGTGTAATNVSPDTALLPVVQTQVADHFTPDSAQLNGQANPNGSPTAAWFEWGTTTNYGNVTTPQAVGSGASPVSFSNVINGLVLGTGYQFRAVVSNAFGIVVGSNGFFTHSAFVQTIISNLPGVYWSSAAWGDYDNDGRLDFLLTGSDGGTNRSQLWRNTASGFTNVTASVAPGLPGVSDSSVAWGDYDNDGRLDFLLTGFSSTGEVSQLWRNTGSGFTNVTASVAPGLPGVGFSSVAWGDYDNDGRLDFLLTGFTSIGEVSQLWRNTGNGFSNVTASVAPGLPGVNEGCVAWGDYDNDGQLDFLITGAGASIISQLWRNTGSGFTNATPSVAPGLPAVYFSAVAWGDYNHDGRLDFLLTGLDSGDTNHAELWRNTGSGFTNVTASVAPDLPGVNNGSLAWGDYDNDGQLDFLLTGALTGNPSRLWRNTGSGFTNVSIALPGVNAGSAAWGDYDNDGRLDFLITGNAISELWRNNLPVSNTPPAAPTGLAVTWSAQGALLSWNAAADAQTPSAGLSYNIRIGSASGAGDIVSPQALASGFRLLPQRGNAGQRLSARIPLGFSWTYYCSVQAVDSAFAGSPFAGEQSFSTGPELIYPFRYMSGIFEFYFTNLTSTSFDVLVATNAALPLVNWMNLGPATPVGGGRYRFVDFGAIGEAQRYYMLREQ